MIEVQIDCESCPINNVDEANQYQAHYAELARQVVSRERTVEDVTMSAGNLALGCMFDRRIGLCPFGEAPGTRSAPVDRTGMTIELAVEHTMLTGAERTALAQMRPSLEDVRKQQQKAANERFSRP